MSHTTEIWKEFTFDSAHLLPNVPLGHKCGRLHGHTFRVRITLRGQIDKKLGWLVDYADIKKAWAPIFEKLDHRFLNDVPGLENPTSENLARWVWSQLQVTGPEGFAEMVHSVTVQETCTTAATVSVG